MSLCRQPPLGPGEPCNWYCQRALTGGVQQEPAERSQGTAAASFAVTGALGAVELSAGVMPASISAIAESATVRPATVDRTGATFGGILMTSFDQRGSVWVKTWAGDELLRRCVHEDVGREVLVRCGEVVRVGLERDGAPVRASIVALALYASASSPDESTLTLVVRPVRMS